MRLFLAYIEVVTTHSRQLRNPTCQSHIAQLRVSTFNRLLIVAEHLPRCASPKVRLHILQMSDNAIENQETRSNQRTDEEPIMNSKIQRDSFTFLSRSMALVQSDSA